MTNNLAGTRYNNQDNVNAHMGWLENTILITGDSMLNQLDEDRLSKSVKKCVKVR